jgi:hypothetical protein
MANISFSLTQRCIVNPILYMRADLNSDTPPSIGKKIYHSIEKEAFARINGVFTSVFAAMDAFIHFSTGCYKGTRLLLGIKSTYNKTEVARHFRRAVFYSVIALVGSIAATIWPSIVKSFKQSPIQPFKQNVNVNKQIPTEISHITDQSDAFLQCGRINTAHLHVRWSSFDLSAKHWFVITCNQEGSELFSTIRKVMATVVYRPIAGARTQEEVRWLNDEEMEENFKCSHERDFGYYYHATSEEALRSILRSKKVEVRHEKAFRGAFVSTEPELAFGKCVLVFNRTIERLSRLEHGFTLNETTYWAGFSEDIPVSDTTISCIAINSQDEKERRNFETQCSQWAGRDISVVLINEIRSELKQIQQRHVGIPAEWPDEGQAVGMNIIGAMQRALAIPTQQLQKVKVRSHRPEGMPTLLRQPTMTDDDYASSRRVSTSVSRGKGLLLAN